MHRAKLMTLGGVVGMFACSGALGAHLVPSKPFCVLSVEETAGTLAIIDGQGEVRRRVAIGDRPHEIEVSPDGRFAYVSQFGIADYDNRIGTPGNRIVKIDLHTGERVREFDLPAAFRAPHGVKLRPPGFAELFTNAESGDAMLVFDAASGRLLRSFPLPKATHNFIFAQDGKSIFSFAGAEGATKLDATDGRIQASQNPGSPIRGLFLTRSGSVLAGARGEILELRPTDLGVIRRIPAPRPGQFVYLAQLPDGTIIAPSLTDGGVAIFPFGGAPARFVTTGQTPISIRYGPDGLVYVAHVGDHHISILTAEGTFQRTIGGLITPNGLNFGNCD